MRKFFLLVCFANFILNFAIAQVNLVPNPSFEDTITCPDAGSQVSRARYWHAIENSPDYFHECCIYPAFSIPDNIVGHQYPATGNAYVGLYDYSTVIFYREIIGAYLTSPMIIGVKYFVTLKASLAWNLFYSVNTATNKLGILFSTVDYLSMPPPINNYAQVFSDSIINDSIGWTTIRGSFIADSAYIFLSIGNFFDDSHTDTIHLGQWNAYEAYYYIDDVCVSTDSLYCETWTKVEEQTSKEKILIYPNPTDREITIRNIPFGCRKIDVYDIQGRLIKAITTDRNSRLIIDISSLAEGIYSLVLKKENSIQVEKFIKTKN